MFCFFQFKLDVTVKPADAKLTIDGKEQTLTAGKLAIEENIFGTKLQFVTMLDGHVKDERTVTIEAKDNVVEINLEKDKVSFKWVRIFGKRIAHFLLFTV